MYTLQNLIVEFDLFHYQACVMHGYLLIFVIRNLWLVKFY